MSSKNKKTPVNTEVFVAGTIEISNQLISDLLEFVEVAEALINDKNPKSYEILTN